VCNEKTANLVEDLLRIVLNNPMCYSNSIVDFFRKHNLFSVFPSVQKYFDELKTPLAVIKSKAHQSERKTAPLTVVAQADSVVPRGNVLDWVSVSSNVVGFGVKIGKDQKDFTEY
jgi:hypothetical protein